MKEAKGRIVEEKREKLKLVEKVAEDSAKNELEGERPNHKNGKNGNSSAPNTPSTPNTPGDNNTSGKDANTGKKSKKLTKKEREKEAQNNNNNKQNSPIVPNENSKNLDMEIDGLSVPDTLYGNIATNTVNTGYKNKYI